MIKSCGLLWSWGDMKRPQTLITRYRPGKHRPTSVGPPAAGSMITIWGPASVLVTPDRPEAMITTGVALVWGRTNLCARGGPAPGRLH